MAKYDLNYEVLDEEKKKEVTAAEEFIDWVEVVMGAFFTVILVFTLVLRVANVEGSSMVPTLTDGDRLVVSHLGYEPQVGDIVIVNCEGLGNKVIVKRIIAVENQTVEVDPDAGIVKVDGKVIDEPYINEATKTDEGFHDYPVTVPSDCVFVMGDNRMNSTDSRSEWVGFVNEDDILGKVVFRFFPFTKIGSV